MLKKGEIEAVSWAVYELTTLFTLSVLNICEELYYFSDHERRNALLEGVISGEMSIKKRNEIVKASAKFAYELIKSQIPDFIVPTNVGEQFKIYPPKYFEALDNLIMRMIHNPLDYYDILRPIDYLLMEYDLLVKECDYHELEIMFSNFERNKRGIKTIMHFICQVTGIPRKLYQIISTY